MVCLWLGWLQDKSLGSQQTQELYWITKMTWPKGIQVMCVNNFQNHLRYGNFSIYYYEIITSKIPSKCHFNNISSVLLLSHAVVFYCMNLFILHASLLTRAHFGGLATRVPSYWSRNWRETEIIIARSNKRHHEQLPKQL